MRCEGNVVAVSDGDVRKATRSKDSPPAWALRIRWSVAREFDEQESFSWRILNQDEIKMSTLAGGSG